MNLNPQQHEHDIDEALRALRIAQPASGNTDEAFTAMNARLLRNLRASAPTNTERWGWLSQPRIAFAAAALAAVWIGTLLLPALRFHPNQSAAISTPDAPSVTALSSRVGSTGRQPADHRSAQRGSEKPSSGALRRVSSISGLGRPADAPSNAADLDPAFLPSHPAPEVPLTRQERLLQSMANRRKPVLLALLEPREPDLSTLSRAAGTNPLFAGFQPEPQPAPQPEDTADPIPQPEL